MLRVEGVDAYYGLSHVLQGVSLTVESGEAVALLGRNGAGKTTTLKAIMAVVPARRGRITWNEKRSSTSGSPQPIKSSTTWKVRSCSMRCRLGCAIWAGPGSCKWCCSC